MEIFRDGRRVVDRRPPKSCGYCNLIPAAAIELEHPVSVIQLDGSPEPEVVFDFWTGGAHCCLVSFIFNWNAGAGMYESTQHNFYDFGYRFIKASGSNWFSFQGWDWRFGYRFGCFGCSAFPPQVWRYRVGRLIDATRSYPGIVKADRRKLRRIYRNRGGKADVRPVLAALVADECLLGRRSAGMRLLDLALHRGYLRHPHRDTVWPLSRAYVHKLRRFLRHTGYC